MRRITLPAGSNGKLGLQLGSVHGVVLSHQERLQGDAVDEQGHRGELDVQHVMMPFLIADLRWRERGDGEEEGKGRETEDEIRLKDSPSGDMAACGACYAYKEGLQLFRSSSNLTACCQGI